VVKHRLSGHCPAWLAPEVARAIARAAAEVLSRNGNPDEARAAARALAVACLPSLPAPMLAEAVAAVAPTEAPPPDHVALDLVPANANRLAERLGLLSGEADRATGAVAGRTAARLAAAGAEWLGAHHGGSR
jgi:hypothetical protein